MQDSTVTVFLLGRKLDGHFPSSLQSKTTEKGPRLILSSKKEGGKKPHPNEKHNTPTPQRTQNTREEKGVG